jgi:predicted metalloprotease with PDZ domain
VKPRPAPTRKKTDWQLSYAVRVANPALKTITVDAAFVFPDSPGPIDLFITDVDGHYTPGYAQFVKPTRFVGPDKTEIALTQASPNRWRPTATVSDGEYHLEYMVTIDHLSKPNPWGHKETPRLGANGGVLIGSALFVVPKSQATSPTYEPPTPRLGDAEVAVSWSLPPNWRVVTPWPKARSGATEPVSVDDLLDNFLVVGPSDAYEVFESTLGGSTVRAAIARNGWAFPNSKLWGAFDRIIRQSATIFGGLPSTSYLLVISPAPGTRQVQGLSDGGGAARQSFNAELDEKYTTADLSGLRPLRTLAHETFHWWNPAAFPPASTTDAYWWTEGVTVYYETLLLWRAGIISQDDFLSTLAQHYDRGERRNGARPSTSLLEASRKITGDGGPEYDEAYYLGAVCGFALDLEIRRRSEGARSLDNLLRELAARHKRTGRGFTLADLADEATLVAGSDLRPFFARHVEGREPLDFQALLASVGYQERHVETGRPYLGVTFEPEAAEPTVRSVQQGSPADGALKAGDVVVALGALRTPTLASFSTAIANRKPGDSLAIVYRREGRPKSTNVTLRSRQDLRAVPLVSRTAGAAALLAAMGRSSD